VSVASVHLVDVGAARALPMLRGPGEVEGLLSSETAVAAPLRAGRLAVPMPGRVALVAFWTGDAALDAFLDAHPFAERFRSGWWARLEPLRAFGDWPGLGADVSRARTVRSEGPTVVLTLGRLRLRRALSFLRASRPAEGAAVDSPGLAWGTALARPPFVSTLSLWESARAAAAYAYGNSDGGHPRAIAADRAHPFHRLSAFIRFRPLEVHGSLGSRNPLPEGAVGGRQR
jgi:hypothetical protein